MELKAQIASKDGVWRAKIDTLGIDMEVVPPEYDLSDLPDVLAKIEQRIREKTMEDLDASSELTILQTDLKISVSYSVRSPRDRTFADFATAPADEEIPGEPLAIEGPAPLLLEEGEVDIDALVRELDDAAAAANGAKVLAVFDGDMMITLGSLARKKLEAGDMSIADVRGYIASFQADADQQEAVAEAIDGE